MENKGEIILELEEKILNAQTRKREKDLQLYKIKLLKNFERRNQEPLEYNP
eukprot:Pgem_evm1s14521